VTRFDFDDPPPTHQFSIRYDPVETTGERTVRLAKEFLVFLLAAGFVSTIFYLAFVTVTNPSSSPEEKKWAMSVLSAGAAGLVGYLVRR
jgi:hypothetical protein